MTRSRSVEDAIRQAATHLPAPWRDDVLDLADKLDQSAKAMGRTPIGMAAKYTLFEETKRLPQIVLKSTRVVSTET